MKYTCSSATRMWISKIDTDVDMSDYNPCGPWSYKNSNNVWIHYTVDDREDLGVQKICLKNLIRRGFPTFQTPTKRKSINSSEIESPLKKLNIADDESTTPKFEFKTPFHPLMQRLPQDTD